MKSDFIKSEITIKLKKKTALFYKKELDSQAIKLNGFALHSVLEKQIKLSGANLDVTIMIYKAVK